LLHERVLDRSDAFGPRLDDVAGLQVERRLALEPDAGGVPVDSVLNLTISIFDSIDTSVSMSRGSRAV
jgi:hypothetical protein